MKVTGCEPRGRLGACWAIGRAGRQGSGRLTEDLEVFKGVHPWRQDEEDGRVRAAIFKCFN